MDLLMEYINAHPEFGVNVFYSTPSIYYQAVKSLNLPYTIKTDDFMPYGMVRRTLYTCTLERGFLTFLQAPHTYLTGYYTSRPALKGVSILPSRGDCLVPVAVIVVLTSFVRLHSQPHFSA